MSPNTVDRMQIDTLSMRNFQGSVFGYVDSLLPNFSFNKGLHDERLENDDIHYILQDPAVKAAQESERILNFLAGEPVYDYGRRQSVPEAQVRMARKLAAFEMAFGTSDTRRSTL